MTLLGANVVERATVCGAQRIGAAAIAEWPCRCAGDRLREKTDVAEMERRGWTGKRGSWKSACGHEHGTAALTVFCQAAIPRAGMGREGEGGKQQVEQRMFSVKLDWLRRFHPSSAFWAMDAAHAGCEGTGRRRVLGASYGPRTSSWAILEVLTVHSQPAAGTVDRQEMEPGTLGMIYADMMPFVCLF